MVPSGIVVRIVPLMLPVERQRRLEPSALTVAVPVEVDPLSVVNADVLAELVLTAFV